MAERSTETLLWVLGPEKCRGWLKQRSLENFFLLIPGNTWIYSVLHGKGQYFCLILLQKPQAQQWDSPSFSREYAMAFSSIMGVSSPAAVPLWPNMLSLSHISLEWLGRICGYEESSELFADPSSVHLSFSPSLNVAGCEKLQASKPLCGTILPSCFLLPSSAAQSVIFAILTSRCFSCRSPPFVGILEDIPYWLIQ